MSPTIAGLLFLTLCACGKAASRDSAATIDTKTALTFATDAHPVIDRALPADFKPSMVEMGNDLDLHDAAACAASRASALAGGHRYVEDSGGRERTKPEPPRPFVTLLHDRVDRALIAVTPTGQHIWYAKDSCFDLLPRRK